MKAICEGRSTRNDVVQQNLEQYRAVFNRTVQQINVLKSVRMQFSLLLLLGAKIGMCSGIANVMRVARPSPSMSSTRITDEGLSTRGRVSQCSRHASGDGACWSIAGWMSCRGSLSDKHVCRGC